MSYTQIDWLCDRYIPSLALVLILVLARRGLRLGWRAGLLQTAWVIGSIITGYVMMALDKYLGLWASFNLDFSTHTLMALIGAAWLWLLIPRLGVKITLVCSSILYGFLMWYQQYHSLADMLTTAVVAAAIMAIFSSQRANFWRRPVTISTQDCQAK